jgi:hypothetical protein
LQRADGRKERFIEVMSSQNMIQDVLLQSIRALRTFRRRSRCAADADIYSLDGKKYEDGRPMFSIWVNNKSKSQSTIETPTASIHHYADNERTRMKLHRFIAWICGWCWLSVSVASAA